MSITIFYTHFKFKFGQNDIFVLYSIHFYNLKNIIYRDLRYNITVA